MGHGCSASWRVDGGSGDWVSTTNVPQYPMRLMVSNPTLDLPALALDFLASAERSSVCKALAELPAVYGAWIDRQRAEPLDPKFQDAADVNIAGCMGAADRIADGVRLLETDPIAWEAFRLASRAMLTVRSRSEWHREGRPESGPKESGLGWRPFQLGFMLACLRGIADQTHPDRLLSISYGSRLVAARQRRTSA